MENFQAIGLPTSVLDSLDRLMFKQPTPIQAKVIPLALLGQDILGVAGTGTGKTAAYGLPLVTHLLNNQDSLGIVIVPTRELAEQVKKMLDLFLGQAQRTVKSALLIGGESIVRQLKQLSSKPRLIVGTPGRINDHLSRRSLKLQNADFLVLDEADRMLDMGFSPQIADILRFMSENRQTLLFSATMPDNIVRLANQYLHNPAKVVIEQPKTTEVKLQQEILYVTEATKYQHLLEQLESRDGSVIVFVKTKHSADKIAIKLCESFHDAAAIHGDLTHHKRSKVINDFRNSKYRIMIATDIAARGLDIAEVRHVINYDLPQCPEDYVHRIGRTARAGATGVALCFLTPSDRGKWSVIRKLVEFSAIKELNVQVKGEPGERRERSDRSSRNARNDFGARGGRPSGNNRDFKDRDFKDGRSFGRSKDSRDSFSRNDSRDTRDSRDSFGRNDSRDARDSRGGFAARNATTGAARNGSNGNGRSTFGARSRDGEFTSSKSRFNDGNDRRKTTSDRNGSSSRGGDNSTPSRFGKSSNGNDRKASRPTLGFKSRSGSSDSFSGNRRNARG